MNRNKLLEHEGIEVIQHPAYSSDRATSDYNSFQSMALFLHLQHFNNSKEVEASVKEFFTLKDKNWYQLGINKPAGRWLEIVQHDSLCLECLAVFVVN